MTFESSNHGGGEGPGPLYLSPYELWNFGVGKPYAFSGIRRWSDFLTVLTELPKESSPAAIATAPAVVDPKPPNWWTPTLWKATGLTFIPFVVEKPLGFTLDVTFLQTILLDTIFALIRTIPFGIGPHLLDVKAPRFRVAFPVPNKAMNPLIRSGNGPTDPTPERDDRAIGNDKHLTVVAVIDDGLAFANKNFRDADGRTRIEFCWLQSIACAPGQTTVLFGREYGKNEIDDLVAKYGDDEDALYREAGATLDAENLGSLLDRHATHGSHVMDLTTGYAPERGEVPPKEVRIIAVQLPNTIAWDTSGFGKDMYMLSAFHYIFNRADIIASKYGVEKLRLVINFSYGFSAGRHDGGMELEAAIDQLICKRRACRGPTALVLPAGNVFQDRTHGRIMPADFSDGYRIRWRIQPNDRTPSYLELWFGKEFEPGGYSIEIWDPWNRLRLTQSMEVQPSANPSSDPIRSGTVTQGDGSSVGQVSIDQHRGDRWRVLVVLAPTEPDDPALARIECGEWGVVIKRSENAEPPHSPIHCWIQRSADPETLRSGSRQSYLDDPANIRFTQQGDLNEEDTQGAFVRRFGSLSGLATGSTPLVVAGYRYADGLYSKISTVRAASYSSAGTLEPGWPEAHVDCSSMSDRSKVLLGTIASGVRSGSLSLLDGTSVAAPFVARQLATIFTTADEAAIQAAECANYLPLLHGYRPKSAGDGSICHNSAGVNDDNESKARLGEVRVPPRRKAGI